MPQCALPGILLEGAYPSTRSSNRKKDADMKSDFLFKAVTLKARASKALTLAAALLLGFAA